MKYDFPIKCSVMSKVFHEKLSMSFWVTIQFACGGETNFFFNCWWQEENGKLVFNREFALNLSGREISMEIR